MLHNPYKIVKMFEEEVAAYTGAPFAVSTDSCTSALQLCCELYKVDEVRIPACTYLSVPMAIINAGGKVIFDTRSWQGAYQLKPYPIWDSAKRLTSGMYQKGQLMCLSFHIKKHLKIGKGGMILTDNEEFAKTLRKTRYEGRGEVPYKQDEITLVGHNFYMTPEEAARGLVLMQNYPLHAPDLIEEGGYRNLVQFPVFAACPVVNDDE